MTSTIVVTLLLLVYFFNMTIEDSQEDHWKDSFYMVDEEVQDGNQLLQEVLRITPKIKTHLQGLMESAEWGGGTDFLGCCGHQLDETLKSTCLSTAKECLMYIVQTEWQIKRWIEDESAQPVRQLPSEVGEPRKRQKILEYERKLMGEAIDSIICMFDVSRLFLQMFQGLYCYFVPPDLRGKTRGIFEEVHPIAFTLLMNGERCSSEAARRYYSRVVQYKGIMDFYQKNTMEPFEQDTMEED